MNLIGHYTKAQTLIDYILPNESLKLNELKNTNDPWEYKKSIYVQITENMLDLRDRFQRMDKITTYIENIKSISFTNDLIKEKKRCFCNSLMWAHYGNNHKGVCLVFDKNKIVELFNNQHTNILGSEKIDYVDISEKLIIDNNSTTKLVSQIGNLLFQKPKDWHYEEEYRLIIEPNKKESYIKNISSALIAIFLGGNISEKKECTIKCIQEKYYSHAKLYKMIWDKQDIRTLDLSDDSINPPCYQILNK